MIIDFHTHIFPDVIAAKTIEKLEGFAKIKAASDGTLNGLLHSMELADVDLSVILPVVTKPQQFSSVNAFAAKTNARYEENEGKRLISFGGIHPDSDNYKAELKEIKALGLKGIKLHPDYQRIHFDDIRYMRIVDFASTLGLCIVVHAGVDIGLPEHVHCTPMMSRKVIDEVQPEKLVLAHIGGHDMWDDVCEYLVGQNVYLDTAYSLNKISDEMLLRIIKEHGSDKILFATDSPWSDPKTDIAHLRNLGLSDETLDQIFGLNAMSLLGLNA